jgi:serine/threonine-protein kinase HipA
MAWEKVATDLAATAGIDVPRSELLEIAGRHVLVVDRFDRTAGGERVGYVSAMTMLEARDGDQRSYLEIAEVIETRSLSPTTELHQLWRRIVFSILVSNTDDHLRNHGFLHDRGDSWRLSPAFDLNPDPTPGAKSLSTLIDTGDAAADLDLARSVSGFFRLTTAQADGIIGEVSAAVSRWRRVAAAHGLPASEIDRMSAAFPSGP